ncbi:BZ3500_MvSof-1268-A1-R1_Chr4-3g07279 [Microbotryum saponariae]|uniref:F-actin-capping protein subunit beta n=1 Tax=Microbotryum saponariae TaxID=289078 RepID=A0A2X0NGR3_9BASI|nr:BZ3500_MvSof-1268-A1-R1_Chr4-3g07279 [Microbotryum saponariae]SDA06942.1 BZ3501_MvSof-1269-A2-R1_Chr4-2g06988 [Microbotryum saponariae]
MSNTKDEDTLSACLDLARRLPPHRIEHNLGLLCDILPDLADDILSSVDQPLKVHVDRESKQYLVSHSQDTRLGRMPEVCDYNRDGESSPWTNAYDPPLADGTTPSPKLRQLEITMNDSFDVYRDLYYEGGVSSVYLWDVDGGFAGVVLLQKLHVFEASERGRTAHYKLTSTVMLYISRTAREAPEQSEFTLCGSMTRQNELEAPLDPASNQLGSHIVNLGRLIEDMEIKMRNLLQEVYFSSTWEETKDIVSSLRSTVGYGEQNKRLALQGELVGLLRGKNAAQAGSGLSV